MVPDVGQRVVSCGSAGRELNNLFTTGACWETAGGSVSETKQMLGFRRISYLNTDVVWLRLSQFLLYREKEKSKCVIKHVAKLLRKGKMNEAGRDGNGATR